MLEKTTNDRCTVLFERIRDGTRPIVIRQVGRSTEKYHIYRLNEHGAYCNDEEIDRCIQPCCPFFAELDLFPVDNHSIRIGSESLLVVLGVGLVSVPDGRSDSKNGTSVEPVALIWNSSTKFHFYRRTPFNSTTRSRNY